VTLQSILLSAVLATASHAAPATHTATPGQRVAAKALAGAYGKLSAWQHKGYTALLRHSEPRLLVVTGYWPGEVGGTHGKYVRDLFPGCMASNKLPAYSFVYMPSWGRLFRVLDTGAKSNDSRHNVTRHGTLACWADVWLGDGLTVQGRCDWTATSAEVAR
jgi:hypothetical protein